MLIIDVLDDNRSENWSSAELTKRRSADQSQLGKARTRWQTDHRRIFLAFVEADPLRADQSQLLQRSLHVVELGGFLGQRKGACRREAVGLLTNGHSMRALLDLIDHSSS